MDSLDRIKSRAQKRRLGIYMGGRIGKGLCELQHDQNVANADGATVRSDINNALGALFSVSSGTSAPSTTIAYQLWADTTNNLLKQRNASNTAWIVRGNVAESFLLSRSSNTVLGVADFGRSFIATSTFTQTLTAAATLADGWYCNYRNDGVGTITIDPNSSETIDGAATISLQPGEGCLILCDGANFKTVGRAAGQVPIGAMLPYGGTVLPTGYLACDGSNVSRSTYAALFAALIRSSVVTITIATPGVVTWNAHGLSNGDVVKFSTTGALPTGITAGTTYFVRNASTNSFEISTTETGSSINTTGSQSGVQTAVHAPNGDGDGSTTFGVPDSRRRTIVGRGGTPNSTLGARLGATGGEDAHASTIAEMPAHTHSTPGFATAGGSGVDTGVQSGTTTTGSTGSGTAHNNIQQSLVATAMIRAT